jgi:ABC-type antimicrobial peptide transport system permease subunit
MVFFVRNPRGRLDRRSAPWSSPPFDPVAYASSLLFIVTACACAALIPALRAVRSDPVAALRHD